MAAITKPTKRNRLKTGSRNQLDRSVSPAPIKEAVFQSTSQPSPTQEDRRPAAEHQRTTINPTATLGSLTNIDVDNAKTETFRPCARDSLWEDALSKLETSSSMEDRSHARALREFANKQDMKGIGRIGDAESDGNDLIERVKRAAEIRRAEAERKAWEVEIGTRTIVLRDTVTRIIDCLNKFKEVGDLAVQYDPVHAALPWAVFRFLLQAATLKGEQTEHLLAGIHAATQAYLRARIYQDLYLDLPDRQNVVDALKNRVIDLLTAICAFLGLSVKYIWSGSIANAARGLLSPKRLARCTENITRAEAQVEKNALFCKAVVDTTARQRQGSRYDKLVDILEAQSNQFHSLQDELKKVKAGVGQLMEALSDEEVHKISTWISVIPYESDLYNARKGRLEGTCEWLIAHKTYKQWKASLASMTLWLHGIPGAGKTKLSTKVVDDITPTDVPIAYFFCDRNQENRRDPLFVLHSITRQLSRTSERGRIKKCTVDAYNKKKEHSFASDKLTNEESRDLLLKLVNGNPRSAIIIDGLDECDEGSRDHILDTLDHLVQYSSSIVKVFVASRNDKDLTQHYSSSPNLEIEATHNQEDIEKLIMNKICSSPWAAEGMSVHVREEVVRLFQEKSQGMFQWASLHIDELLELESDQAILDWLHSMPEGLKATYDRIYSGLGKRWRIYADRAFKWLMAARYKQMSPELLSILVCQDERKQFDFDAQLSCSSLLFACRNLIKVDEYQKFREPQETSFDIDDYADDSFDESYLYQYRCIIHDPEDQIAHIYGFGKHKASYTCRFAHLSVQEYLETYRLDLIESERMILETSIKFWQCVSTANKQKQEHNGGSTAKDTFAYKHAPTYKQLKSLTTQPVLDFLRSAHSEANQDIWDQLLQTTKGYDVVLGSSCWRALCESTPDRIISHPYLEKDELKTFASPIGMCAWFDNQAPIRHWIENGLFNPKVEYKTARQLVTATYRHQQITVCNLFLDAGTNFEGESSDMLISRLEKLLRPELAFGTDIYSLFIRLLKRLFEDGVPTKYLPTNHELYDGTYPMDIARMFLQRGADTNVSGAYKTTPLMHAVSCGDDNIEMTKLLLQHGADVNSVDEENGTSLHHAAQASQNLATLKLLLDNGGDPNIGGMGETTLSMHLVSWGDRKKVLTELLLQYGAEVCLTGDMHRTPLHYAAQSTENFETLRLLLDHGVDPNTEAVYGDTPLHYVAIRSDVEAMKLLLESNARVDSVFTLCGERSLAAAFRGSRGKEINDLLKAHGADQRVMSYLEANARMPPRRMVSGKMVYDFSNDPPADLSSNILL